MLLCFHYLKAADMKEENDENNFLEVVTQA